MESDPVRLFVRHTVATLAYRGAKILRDAPPGFGDFPAGGREGGSRSPLQILAHVGDLLDWTALLAAGAQGWHASPPVSWDPEVERFFQGLRKVDAALAAAPVMGASSMSLEQVFQGPIADAFTHIGQLAYLRRMAGAPVRGEVMVLSEIKVGRLGPEQAPPVREFD